jgi:antitoxin YefM
MATISISKARANLEQLIDETAESHIPVTITGKRNDAVLIPAEDWALIQGMLHALSPPEQHEFMVRAMASRDEAQFTREYADAEAVLSELDEMFAKAEARAKAPK